MTPTPRPVAAIGVGQTRFGPTSEAPTYVELLQRAASQALESAAVAVDDIDAVVLALAPESLMGVNHAERWCIDYIGGQQKPVMRIQTGGATGLSAIQAGYQHVASGLYERVLVVGADRVRESGDAQKIFNKIWDPFYERALPFTTITMIAMSAVRYMHNYGMTERQMADVSRKAHHNGVLNPNAHIRREVTIEEALESRYLAWPLKLLDACPQSAGGCAVVLSSEDAVDPAVHEPAWITGISMAGETYYIGDRLEVSERGYDYGDAEALAVAAESAYAMAGITDPRTQIDAVETYASFTPGRDPQRRSARPGGSRHRRTAVRGGLLRPRRRDPAQPLGRRDLHQPDQRDRNGPLRRGGPAGAGQGRGPPGPGSKDRRRHRRRRVAPVLQCRRRQLGAPHMTTTPSNEPWIVEQHWDIKYNHSADPVTATFLRTLRDEGRLVGIRCPVCRRVLAPPRPICDRDFCETRDWVDLGTTGTLELFTIMYLAIDGLPDPPYVLAYVTPEGADTAIGGFLEGVDLSSTEAAVAELKIGAPVTIEFREERVGRITDLYFRLAG